MSGFSINYRFYGFILIKEPQITQIVLIKFQDAQAHEFHGLGWRMKKIYSEFTLKFTPYLLVSRLGGT